jgi:hypothetical protein
MSKINRVLQFEVLEEIAKARGGKSMAQVSISVFLSTSLFFQFMLIRIYRLYLISGYDSRFLKLLACIIKSV